MDYYLNCWYMAGWSADLGDKPVGRTLLEQPVVLFRDARGGAVALGGMCPHRFAPLGDGTVVGDNIMCPYHGLQFDRTGTCIFNPHGDGHIPANAKVANYPVVEKNGAIWIWMGSAADANPDDITNTDWLVKPDAYSSIHGYLRVNANYQMVVDNLLDLTHAPFLHPNTVGGKPEESAGMLHEFHTDGEGVIHSNYFVSAMPRPSPQLMPFWGDRPGDFRAEMRWRAACTLELDIRFSPVGADKHEGIHMPSLHYLVPESESVTHYFYAMGRNVMLNDAEIDAAMAAGARQAFEDEDEPMIKACQDLMGTTDLMLLNPVILKTDIAGVQARRKLTQLIKAQ
ncbi:MAG: Rieske 2Fe-2S domain-containing protein [Novosphingobium sp.]